MSFPTDRDTRFAPPAPAPTLLSALRRLAALGAVIALAACGGGNDDEDTAPAEAPAPAVVDSKPPSSGAEAQSSTKTLKWRGINLSGAEFTHNALPGRYGYQYVYPSVSSVDYFKGKGMNLVRLPFRWERLQPKLNESFDATELARLKDFVAGATAKGVTVLIDPHNYARYRSQVIGSAGVPYAAFGDFWSRLSTVFKGNPKVIFGVMNEPFGMATENWVHAANEAIRRIRATGAKNTITVPGNAWTGAHSWTANWYGTPNAQAMLEIVDSGHNILFEAHQYLDADSSGTSSTCKSSTIGSERLVAFTTWLRAHGRRGLLGEFAGANNATCKAALANMLSYMEANGDVWAGWTYWAAGPWWGDDVFSLEPTRGDDKPQMKTLQPFLN